jgi:hypothetical protein
MSLWSYADVFAGHQRRYSRRELAEKVRAAGFEIEYITYCMAVLVPILWLKRRLLTAQGLGVEQGRALFLKELHPPPMVNGVLRWILTRGVILIRAGRALPFGTSLLVVASRPPG